ncbi:MAG: trypsin-like peptidase domain-containing protein [Chloroflexi bacterium]|nr:trypsin-like peptidase domain-containing protein [Chloroflexota bacterium]
MLISDTEVLTAYHVVRGVSSVTLILPATVMDGEQQASASVKGYDSDLDIALLTLTPFPDSI